MLKQVFSVYDSKAEFFADPMYAKTTAEMLRGWHEAVHNDKLDIGQYPADYTLFHIATFNLDTGELSPLDNGKVNLGTALEAQAKTSNGNS